WDQRTVGKRQVIADEPAEEEAGSGRCSPCLVQRLASPERRATARRASAGGQTAGCPTTLCPARTAFSLEPVLETPAALLAVCRRSGRDLVSDLAGGKLSAHTPAAASDDMDAPEQCDQCRHRRLGRSSRSPELDCRPGRDLSPAFTSAYCLRQQ